MLRLFASLYVFFCLNSVVTIFKERFGGDIEHAESMGAAEVFALAEPLMPDPDPSSPEVAAEVAEAVIAQVWFDLVPCPICSI
jgi:hypothetical protein